MLTPVELISESRRAIRMNGPDATIQVKLRGSKPQRGNTRALMKGGPVGVIDEVLRNSLLVTFKAQEVIDAFVKGIRP